jgi:hypothetical protein
MIKNRIDSEVIGIYKEEHKIYLIFNFLLKKALMKSQVIFYDTPQKMNSKSVSRGAMNSSHLT